MNRANWRTVMVVAPDEWGTRISSVLPVGYLADVSAAVDLKRLERRTPRAEYVAIVVADCDAERALAALRALQRHQPGALRVVVFETPVDAGLLAEVFALGAHPIQWPIDAARFAQFFSVTE